ncbi:MAG: helix-turn-helix domain-containing protein [Alphaproteobacteria bacterium]
MLNPVRAGLVRRAQDWRWSSLRATGGLSPGQPWLDVDWLLAQFGANRARAQENYRRYLAAARRAGPVWDHLRDQIYLGSEDFAARLKTGVSETRQLSEVPYVQRAESVALSELAQSSHDSHEAMARAYLAGGATMKAIAEHFGVHYATVSRAVRRHGSA